MKNILEQHKNHSFQYQLENIVDIDYLHPEEAEQASNFLKFVWRETFSDFLSEEPANLLFAIETIKQWIDATNVYIVVERTQDRKIVGIITASERTDHVHITNFYIDPNFQRQGLGTRLLKSVFDKFSGFNIFTLRVFQKNLKARKFYLKQGFCEVSVRDAIFITEKTPSILMEKVLKGTNE